MPKFFQEITKVFQPYNFVMLGNASFGECIKFFSKFLLFAFFLMALVYVPTLVTLPNYFTQQMQKFNSLSITSNFTVVAPVYFPERDAVLVVDTTGMHDKLKGETFLVTKDKLKYKLLGKEYEIKDSSFSDVLSDKQGFSLLLTSISLFILPAIIFWLYAFAWLKYLITIILLASIFFTLFDLTHFRKKWHQILAMTTYSAMIPILLETISAPISADYLVPMLNFAGIDLYLVPLVVHSVLIVVLALILHGVENKSA